MALRAPAKVCAESDAAAIDRSAQQPGRAAEITTSSTQTVIFCEPYDSQPIRKSSTSAVHFPGRYAHTRALRDARVWGVRTAPKHRDSIRPYYLSSGMLALDAT